MHKVTCIRCDKEFQTNHSHQKYCSNNCYNLDYRFKVKDICSKAKIRAKQYGVSFNIDVKYLLKLWDIQEGRCALSNRIFDVRKYRNKEKVVADTPSLDRIVPDKGYIKGNVRFVTFQTNSALNSYGEEALISLCKDILSNVV